MSAFLLILEIIIEVILIVLKQMSNTLLIALVGIKLLIVALPELFHNPLKVKPSK